MKSWLRLLIITLTVGGGFTGFTITLQQLLRPQSQELIYFALLFVFLGLYGFVTASGLLFVHNPQTVRPLFVAFALQIPWISSPLVTYRFTAGFHVTVGVSGGGFTGSFSLGSDWFCSLFTQVPGGIGINLFALLMVMLLRHSFRQSPPGIDSSGSN